MFGTPTSTDTLAPNINSYLRKTEDGRHELNLRVSPATTEDTWIPIEPTMYQMLIVENPDDSTPTVGRLISMLAQARENLREWREKHDTIRSQAFDAIDMIGQRLIEESERRGWCSEFDQIIEEVNSNLPGPFLLPSREREYEVTWSETYYVTVNRSITVTARNESEAEDYARDYDTADTSEILEAVRYNGAEFSDDNGDFEVTEA